MREPSPRARVVPRIVVLLTAAAFAYAFVRASLEHGQDRLWLLAFWFYLPPPVLVGWWFVTTGSALKRILVATGAAAVAFFAVRSIHRIADALFSDQRDVGVRHRVTRG